MRSEPLSVVQRATSPRTIKFFGVGEREFAGTIYDPTVDRYGDIVEPSGCQYADFLRSGTILAQHDATLPIATPLEIDVRADRVDMSGRFPAPGVSETADLYCRLVKSRVLNSFSIGFLAIRAEPIKNGGLRYTEWDLAEVSIVSVPALPSARISERSLTTKRIFDLGAHRYARDVARAAQIRARVPRNLEADLETCERIRSRLGIPKLVTPAEAHAAREEERRRDRAAAGDAVLRFGTMW
jgi:HK97 family phage prohead protease